LAKKLHKKKWTEVGEDKLLVWKPQKLKSFFQTERLGSKFAAS
jgi:hypothetical protein